MEINSTALITIGVALVISAVTVAAIYYFNIKDPDNSISSDEDMNSLLSRPTKEDFLTGKTQNYRWGQSDTELDVYIDVGGDIRARDCKVTILSDFISVEVKDKTLVKGKLFDDITTDSCWQLDTEKGGGKVIWLTLFKLRPTGDSTFWTGVLKDDSVQTKIPTNVPVHEVNPNDKKGMKDLIEKMKKTN